MNKQIALTFDDGPNTTITMDVLNLLKKYKITASFFLIGDEAEGENIESARACHEYGCELCNHSKTHPDMTKLTEEEVRAEIAYTDELILGITGYKPRFFRPPFIMINETMVKNINLPFICGENAEDWVPEIKYEERAKRIIDSVRNGSIILLHDLKGNIETVKALDIIIPELLRQGYEFVNISDLFANAGVKPTVHTGIVYSNVDDVNPRPYDA